MPAGGAISGASNLEVDTDGDGEVDTELPAGGTVMYEDFVADGEEESATPIPQLQSGGGGRNNSIFVTAIATSASTSTTEAIKTTVATSSSKIATTSRLVEQQTSVVKTITPAAPQGKSTIAQRQNATTNNARLLAGAAASLDVAIATSGKNVVSVRGSWWHHAYQTARNIIHFIIGL